MARYTEAVCRLCRRETATSKTGEKIKLFLKGDRCLSKKCAVERRGTAPGQKTQNTKTRQKVSEYGRQLREKQKMRRYYGVLETQFQNYFREAQRVRGKTGATFLQILERRLDNVIYRLGFASDHAEARQLVRHGHFLINGHRVDIPSFLCRSGDQIEVKDGSKKITRVLESLGAVDRRGVPKWLELDKDNFKGKLTALPAREDLTLPIREQLIVELYSR
ncbi:MAG TPA: 30S ribosomal protein S4 [Polyangia bacterium]